MAISIYTRFTVYLTLVCLSATIALHLKTSTLRSQQFHPSVFSIGKSAHPSNIKDSDLATQQETCRTPLPAQYNYVPDDLIFEEWGPSRHLEGNPTKRFRDNLLNDEFYIIGMANGGFTTQFISYVNTIYLGIISQRIPIIPAFVPHRHISISAGALPFGHIFNLSRARNELREPILEWIDVKSQHSPTSTQTKSTPSSEFEQLGCWSTMEEEASLDHDRLTVMEDYLELDISYTRTPAEARQNRNSNDTRLVFSHLVPYIFPGSPLSPSLNEYPLKEASRLGHTLAPNEQLACFDFLYNMTSSSQASEWSSMWSPGWNLVGTHFHFTDDLVHLAQVYLGKAFSKSPDDIPPFIAIHMPRNGLHSSCSDDDDCLIPLGTFHRIANSMKEEIFFRDGTKIRHILLMSDDDDTAFWNAAKDLGWIKLDHMAAKTEEKHGEWYPFIIDMVVQSIATGFIGTEGSTSSLTSSRRIQDWTDGPAILVSRTDRTNLDFIADDF